MLLSFRTANHRSLREEQQLLLTPAYPDGSASGRAEKAVRVAGLFGPNSSGKSNLIDALAYMANVVRWSFRENEPGGGLPRFPFALEAGEPSVYVVDLLLNDVPYTYGFAVDDRAVIEEWLYSYPHKRERTIFERSELKFKWGEGTPASTKQVKELVEPNVLFLSVGARSRQKVLRPVYAWFASLRTRLAGAQQYRLIPGGRLMEDIDLQERMATLLRAADTGISGIEVVDETEAEAEARAARLGPRVRDAVLSRPKKKLLFKHSSRAGDFALPYEQESQGTQQLCYLAMSIFPVLEYGGTLVVDELDASLHTHLTVKVIELFQNEDTNPWGAQLIFSSHDAALLGRVHGGDVLKRDQIWFTEKGEDGATELFPLSDFKPRKEENRERRYLTGRYGAVPNVDYELFTSALGTRVDSGRVPEAR